MRARVTVRLKGGVLDPQGKAIQKSLSALGYDEVESVRQGKLFRCTVRDIDGPPISFLAPLLLALKKDAVAIDGPRRAFRRSTNPVRIGHDPFQGNGVIGDRNFAKQQETGDNEEEERTHGSSWELMELVSRAARWSHS